ncbi:hypothetical protein Cni_G20282 [Canna indica]|uniref:Uncharacterized protein n=1 Tax=Canna indica TaxID=4628 RepID=A0AAQ3QHM5_9LILI|nr:hypothetical protein Cni_G20282 [Canna indica]
MQDLFHIPSCFFSSATKLSGDPVPAAATAKSGKTAVTSLYLANIAGHRRLITVSWCKNLLAHGFSVSVDDASDDNPATSTLRRRSSCCKVEMQPWHFWRKQGSKQLDADGMPPVEVFWNLKAAKFADDPEPLSDFFLAVVCNEETILLLGNMKKKAQQRTASPRPPMTEATLVCRKEHVFGKKCFTTRADLRARGGRSHEISVECKDKDSELVVKIDGTVSVHVRNLRWKFRGNACVWINEVKLGVCWDVHDWLFGHGLRHALFIFNPESSSSTPSPCLFGVEEGRKIDDESGFCLYLYAWRLD